MKQPLKFDLTQASAKTVAGLSIKTWSRAAVIAGVSLALLLPLAIKGFLVFQLTLALIYAVAILGLNLLTGFNGPFSLGHSAFYGIGAYTAAILIHQDRGRICTNAVEGAVAERELSVEAGQEVQPENCDGVDQGERELENQEILHREW